MSYQQQFHSRLLQQLNETNSRNLELQSLLAQKDDQLSTLNARLSSALASPGSSGSVNASHGDSNQLRRRNVDMLKQLNRAQDALATAEAKLKSNTTKFHKIEADLRKQVATLQRELGQCNQQLEGRGSASQQPRKNAAWTASTGVAPRAELDAANAEVKRLRSTLGHLQKQFEQEKREGNHARDLPASDPRKSRHVEEQDDEETVRNLKHEPIDLPHELPSSSTLALEPQPTVEKPANITASRINASLIQKPTQPRKRSRPASDGDACRRSPAKKARSETAIPGAEESEDELDGDEEFSPHPEAAPRAAANVSRSDVKDLQERFEFQAVTQHYPSGDIDAFHSQEDLSDECEELWARIKKQVDEWEEAKGEDWTFEFEKPGYKMVNPPCVTTKLKGKGGKMQWRAGHEGKYACKKCVEEERPCFTWNGEEFWLLPLHEGDRKWPVEDGCEIRYWLNVE
ncbi:hypothetical protein Slin15195_G033950 [Septoria linicola]|uniref:Uncharacterized protein n=1 Tax=Septoria linicola TaxID=215465 RepID=A0A9Q9AQ83_9PEZI|nr:hypothetical protein Slin15195_G033950 [Septoria linicola]